MADNIRFNVISYSMKLETLLALKWLHKRIKIQNSRSAMNNGRSLIFLSFAQLQHLQRFLTIAVYKFTFNSYAMSKGLHWACSNTRYQLFQN